MCGIAGFVGKGNKEVLERMTNSLAHRGPDAAGFYIDSNVGLGHRRLSIIDLRTSANQPMSNEDNTVWIVFNGEIYNYKDLKPELQKNGHRFKTASDTEVIIHAYEEYGEKSFEKLNGMFALALWDKKKNKIILARDRVGEKPLYFSFHNGNLFFSSEIKSFRQMDSVPKVLDSNSLLKYVDQGYIGAPDTIFKDIKKLAPGSFLVFEKGNIKIKNYWELPPSSEIRLIDFRDAVRSLGTMLEDSVKDRMISDVPLGVFLSGGIDSSLVAYYAQKNNSKKIKTFTIKFEDKSFDESNYARRVADYIGSEHYEQKISENEMLSVIDRLPEIMDEPLADPSIIPTFWLSRTTKEKVKVALGGDGADEFFGGYQTFKAWQYWSALRKLPSLSVNIAKNVTQFLPNSTHYFSFDFKVKRALLNFEKDHYDQHFRWLSPFSRNDLKPMLSADYPDYRQSWPATEEGDPVKQSSHLYQKYYLPDDIFAKVDRASMACSLEVRAPFVDPAIIQFANTIPSSYKLRRGKTKFILRELAASVLPKEIANREKHGFAPPVGQWLQGVLHDMAEDLFAKNKLEKNGLFNPDYVRFLWKDFLKGNHYRARQIWTLFIWQLWSSKYL